VRESVEAIRALLRDGEVSYRGETIAIDRFDLWFTPLRRRIPIYLSALFPPMLEVVGELGDGLILTWATREAPARAAAHVATGARRAGRRPEDVEITSLLPCVIAPTRAEAVERMRPRWRCTRASSPATTACSRTAGFPDAARAIQQAWQTGDRAGAARAVPDAMAAAVGVVGTAAECRARIEEYRAAGLALPDHQPAGPGRRGAPGVRGRDPRLRAVEVGRVRAGLETRALLSEHALITTLPSELTDEACPQRGAFRGQVGVEGHLVDSGIHHDEPALRIDEDPLSAGAPQHEHPTWAGEESTSGSRTRR
jgi:hypothetical protein